MDGVDAGCLRFAVRLTPPHARLASGCWLSSTGWDWLPTRLHRKVSEVVVTSHPPFPSFSWRNAKSPPRKLTSLDVNYWGGDFAMGCDRLPDQNRNNRPDGDQSVL